MTCSAFTALLAEHLAGELAQETLALFEAHRAHCPDCRAYAASYESTIRLSCDAFGDLESLPTPWQRP